MTRCESFDCEPCMAKAATDAEAYTDCQGCTHDCFCDCARCCAEAEAQEAHARSRG